MAKLRFIQQFQYILPLILVPSYADTPIKAGTAYFQTINSSDGTVAGQDETYYPRVAAPNKVSATSYFAQDCIPPGGGSSVYRVHSWMGGAMLWATGQQETDGNGYFVAEPGQVTTQGNSQIWPSPVFQQGAVIADPIVLTYSSPPNASNTNPLSRGVNLSLPYPYLAPDAAYGAACQAASSTWQTTPLAIFSDPIPTLLVYPSSSAPTDGVASADSIWQPNAILVDKMGDYSVDLIYQNPSSPYQRSGGGNYIKFTVVQGSPYVFCECLGIQYVVISNRITASTAVSGLLAAATTSTNITGLPANFQYSRIGGNQVDPGQFAETTTLNPLKNPVAVGQGQDNYTTWAVYFNNSAGSFTPGTVTTAPQNSYLTITDTTTPFYFVIAALPTIYEYPHQGAPFDTYANATTQAGYNIDNYAKALGLYAFNFVTNTSVTYAVTSQTFVQTTYTPTLTQRYSGSVSDATKTVMCLMPHHYQNQTFDQNTSLTPTVLPTSSSWSAFSPSSTSSLFYWTIRGNLSTILGSSFATQYIFSNFLPTMPPPYWTDSVPLGPNSTPYATATIGQLLFDSLDNEFVTNLTSTAYIPWDTSYITQDKGIYDVGKSLAKASKQLGLLLHYIQGYESYNGVPASPFYNFFGNGVAPISTNCPGGCAFYSNGYTSLYEQQYNNDYGAQPDRPGAFNPCGGVGKTMIQALSDSLQTSVTGSTTPPNAGMQGAINGYFGPTPTPCSMGYKLSHFAYYDPVAHLVMLYPSSGAPSNQTPWPGRKQSLPIHAGAGNVWESFGVADAFNDHHYQYGWWISAAALTGIYDGSWLSTPTAGGASPPWASSASYGTAIDQLVKDIAYDPSISSSFYSDINSLMQFAKMNFFDQWAGHGWADGIQATIAGGNAGHNENSVGEALQAYASIILWGMATQRKPIVDLGIYLYTTASYAMDSYFFDKNLNYKEGGSFFVPTITTTSPPSGYTFGQGFWDYTIHNTSPATSGTPKMAQSVLNYSADFGQTPENVKLINAFPVTSFSLIFGRNQTYLNAWNSAMETCAFNSLVTTTDSSTWETAFVSTFNMLRALGGNTTSIGIPQTCPPTTASSLTPYQMMLQLFTSQTGNGCPPWGSTGGTYTDPGQSISEVLHFLHIIDHYGAPNWNYYGHSTASPTALVFTAAFKKGSTTTAFAFNPTLSSVTVQFYNVSDNSTAGSSFTVPPKRWASATIP